MNDQRMVDVGLLEDIYKRVQNSHSLTCDQVMNHYGACSCGLVHELYKLRAIIDGPGVEPVAKWIDGTPPFPQNQEWFIAITTYGDKVVLRALPEEYAYDYKTADDTYIKAANIRCWMQFPDCEYLPPKSAPSAPVQAVPDGWQLVPKRLGEPNTPLRSALVKWVSDASNGACFLYNDMWDALLAAAPQPPKESTAQSSAVACPTDKEQTK